MVVPGIQYPHTLTCTVLTQYAAQDRNGNWQQTGVSTEIVQACRAERAAGYKYVKGADGTSVYFSWVLHMPVSVKDIPEGAMLEVQDETGKRIASGLALQFLRGQLHARLWL